MTFQISKKLLKLIKYDIFYSHSLCDFEKIMVENYKCFSTEFTVLSSNDIAAIILELKKFNPIVIDDKVYLNTQMNTSVEILGHTFETNDIDLV